MTTCLALAVAHDGAEIVTAEGLGSDGRRCIRCSGHSSDHDGVQCGYCTPGQICSAVGMLDEPDAGWPSQVSDGPDGARRRSSDEEIRERMSGNLCRCGAYVNIVAAIREAGRA